MLHSNPDQIFMDLIVTQVLSTDAKNRVVGQEDVDLFTMSELKHDEWDYSFPTLVSGNTPYREPTKNTEAFRSALSKQFPFKIDMTNLLLAGGCCSEIYLTGSASGDMDLFVYGLSSPEEATNRVRKLLDDLDSGYRQHLTEEHEREKARNRERLQAQGKPLPSETEEKWKPEYEVKCIRNKNAITVIIADRYTVQIILRLYKSKSEILHGFDLGSSAVGWDGNELYFTSLGKFAHEYSCNIIDTTRRSTTYERRLRKYFERGFEIIFPNLNTAALKSKNLKHGLSEVVDFPYFSFSYNKLKGNKIYLDRFLFDTAARKHGVSSSDYQIEDLHEHNVFYINLHSLAHETSDYYFIHEKHPITDILTSKPTMSRRRVINYFDALKERAESGKSLNIHTIRTYCKDLTKLATVLDDEKESIEDFLADMIENEKQRILKLVKNITDENTKFPIEWRIENPGTQLTGSFNPIMEDPEKWYGEYYSA